MRITEWNVSGYKSILDEGFQATDLNILVGQNNSGKSNVLDSMLDYISLYQEDLDRHSWYSDHVIRRQNHDGITFDVTFEFSNQEHRELIDELNERQALLGDLPQEFLENGDLSKLQHTITVTEGGEITKDVFNININGEMICLSKGPNRDRTVLALESLPSQAYKSVKYRLDNSFSNRLEAFFERWQTIRSARKPKGVIDHLRRQQIDEAGEQLVQVLGTLRMNHSEVLDEISADYCSIMEGITGVQTKMVNDREVTVEIIEEGFDHPFQLPEISTGSKQILILLTAIHLAKENSDILLVEEPEQNLHPGAEQVIYDLLQEASQGSTQVFVTTHSDKFVNQTGVDDLLTVYRNESSVTAFDSVEGREIDDTLSMLGYDKSDVYHSNAVVFVEDQSDKVVLEQFAKELDYPLKERGITFVRVEGDNLYSDAEPMLKVINQLRIPYLFVLDSDEENPGEKEKSVADDIGISPAEIYVLKKPTIESYLIEAPRAIKHTFSIENQDQVTEYLEQAGKRNHSKVLNRIAKDMVGQSMSKQAINGMVARHVDRDEIPDELADLLEQIYELPEEE